MGRETKILLGFLGLLAGVFVGVLSMKLLVPRPPAGAGPDVHLDGDSAEVSHELVEPPTLSPRAWDFAAAPPLVAAAAPPATEPAAAARETGAVEPEYRSRFTTTTAEPPPEDLLPPAPPPVMQPPAEGRFGGRRTVDPFASRPAMPTTESAAVQPPADDLPSAPPRQPLAAQPPLAAAPAAADRSPGAVEPDLLPPVAAAPLAVASEDSRSVAATPVRAATALAPATEPAAAWSMPPRVGTGYTVQQGDSWWSLAETAYGDGRLYRALFAWNRTLDGRVTLAPGTRLEIPSASKLQAAWPALIPR